MPRRRLLLLALPVALVLLGVGALVLWPRTSITRENAEKIEEGMTLAEVEALLGGPARNESGLPDNFINDAFVNVDACGTPPFAERRWASPGYVVIVSFDGSGRVTRHSHADFDVDRSPLDKLRRWLRM
jgi:hypothetical protein